MPPGDWIGMVLMPLTGWLLHSAAPGGFSRILWPLGQRLPGVPENAALAERFAAKALDRRRRALVKLGGDLKASDDAGRHAARIAAKKLRYGAEAFAPLFDGDAKGFVKLLKQLQAQLGAANDMAAPREKPRITPSCSALKVSSIRAMAQ